MKLPVITGFILPNGERIETVGVGHCKKAREYFQTHGFWKNYLKSNLAEDDYMIEKLGAAKVAMYYGKKYIYVPNHHNWYISQIKDIYEDCGYEVHYVHGCVYNSDNCFFCESSCKFPYNQLIIPVVLTNGKIVYAYNPERIGD